jgi:hypothetical protein
MASIILLLIYLTGFYPIGRATCANRKTTILHTVFWAGGAYLSWTGAVAFDILQKEPEFGMRAYLALALTGSASMAVLGARRPGVGAWNFVILGLLVVMMFLWLESRLAEDDLILQRIRMVLLASTVTIGVLNYLPTRLAPAAVLLALGCGLEISILTLSTPLALGLETIQSIARVMVALTPWVAYGRMRQQSRILSEFDQVWLRFRNSYGLVWAQRLREQFNQSAKNSNWPVILRWQGLRVIPGEASPTSEDRVTMLANLRALMKRFGLEEET